MLVLEKIYKSYGPTPVLANVNIRVTKKEMVCLSGPSGTGKSTLLRIAAGIELPDKGIVKQGSRGMGFSFQEPVLLPWKTVMKNMEFVAGYRKKIRPPFTNFWPVWALTVNLSVVPAP